MEIIIEVKNLTKKFSNVTCVDFLWYSHLHAVSDTAGDILRPW